MPTVVPKTGHYSLWWMLEPTLGPVSKAFSASRGQGYLRKCFHNSKITAGAKRKEPVGGVSGFRVGTVVPVIPVKVLMTPCHRLCP